MISEAASHFLCVWSMRTFAELSGETLHFDGFCVILGAWPSRPAKNLRGSTRWAASCGHAYTQLGSARSVHKSHEVAFCLTIAIFRPGWPGSSAITLNGWRLIFPYGQFSAHRPQPMHQSSIITSSELRLRIEPTGHPTMHSGSKHWRHDVATR